MLQKNQLIFFVRKLLFFLLPFYFLIGLYICLDPFKVIFNYQDYYKTSNNVDVGLNRDNVSSILAKRNLKKIDSYILGNSRSLAFRVNTWKKYLNNNSCCFHFDASGESLYGILKKLEFLSNNNADLKNVLIILDHNILSKTNSQKGHLYSISPITDGFMAGYKLQSESINSFFSFKFLKSFLKFKIKNKLEDDMKINHLIDDNIDFYVPETNEIQFHKLDSLINYNSYYTPDIVRRFYKRSNKQIFLNKNLLDKQREMLLKIKNILDHFNTNYRIIISPLYDQLSLENTDTTFLKTLFGNKYFDFSGINEFTNEFYNYYEESHYRPIIAEKILDSIYLK